MSIATPDPEETRRIALDDRYKAPDSMAERAMELMSGLFPDE